MANRFLRLEQSLRRFDGIVQNFDGVLGLSYFTGYALVLVVFRSLGFGFSMWHLGRSFRYIPVAFHHDNWNRMDYGHPYNGSF